MSIDIERLRASLKLGYLSDDMDRIIASHAIVIGYLKPDGTMSYIWKGGLSFAENLGKVY